MFITGTPGYLGGTAINAGTLQINSGTPVTMHAISGAGVLGVDNSTSLTAASINIGTLTIGAGSTITIAAIAGGPLADMESTQSVPEPATWAMLCWPQWDWAFIASASSGSTGLHDLQLAFKAAADSVFELLAWAKKDDADRPSRIQNHISNKNGGRLRQGHRLQRPESRYAARYRSLDAVHQ